LAQGPGSVGLRYEEGIGAVPDWANAASRRHEPGPVSASARGLLQLRMPLWCASASVEQAALNWCGPGESDCLIKTKHRDGRHLVLTQCDFCPVL